MLAENPHQTAPYHVAISYNNYEVRIRDNITRKKKVHIAANRESRRELITEVKPEDVALAVEHGSMIVKLKVV